MEASYVDDNKFIVTDDRTVEFSTNRRLKLDCGSSGIKYASVVSSSYDGSNTTVIIDDSVLTSDLSSVLYSVISTGEFGNLPDHFHTSSEGDGGLINFTSSGTGSSEEIDPVFSSSPAFIITSSKIINWDEAFSWGDHSLVGYLTESSTVSGTDGQDGEDAPTTFSGLSDTPESYEEGKYLMSTGSGTIWSNAANDFLSLLDTPTTYSGQENKFIQVTSNGLQFAPIPSSAWFFGPSEPSALEPASAAPTDLYFNETTGNVLKRNDTVPTVLVEDDFTGTSLDTNKWGTRIVPSASVTVNDVLELNNISGNLHSGAHVYTVDNFPTIGTTKLTCRWKPHGNHYSSARPPYISFRNPSTFNPEPSYGYPTDNCVVLTLGDNYSTTFRTTLDLLEEETEVAETAITISVGTWQDLSITINWGTGDISIDLNNGSYTIDYTLSSSILSKIGNRFVLEFGTADYNKDNTEAFDDVSLLDMPDEVWQLQSNLWPTFSGLSDTPGTYEEGKYLMSTGSGTEWSEISTIYSFSELEETPNEYYGTTGLYLKSTGSGTVWANVEANNIPDSSNWLYGNGNPSQSIGSNNDYYLDGNNGQVWVKDIPSTANVFSGGTLSANMFPVTNLENVLDGNITTFASAQSFGSSYGNQDIELRYDLGIGNETLVVTSKHYSYGIGNCNSMTIQGSHNEVDWDILVSGGGNAGGWYEYTFDNTVAYRYYRFVCTSAPNYFKVSEWELYGDTKEWRQITEAPIIEDGMDGTIWYSGTSSPPDQVIGNTDDFYFNTETNDIYKKDYPSYSLNRATGGTPTSNGSYSNRPETNAFDGDLVTRWTTSNVNNPNWFQYDFGEGVSYPISKISIYSSNIGVYTIYGSNNGSDFDELHSGDSIQASTWVDLVFSNSTSYRYIRLLINTLSYGYINIYELEMYDTNSFNWQLISNLGGSSGDGYTTFSGLSDTPNSYSEKQYFRTTTSGIEAIDGIILTAPDQSEWLIKVTNSGTLYTESV